MECIRCNSKRILTVSAACGDCITLLTDEHELRGYLEEQIGINGRSSDSLRIQYCLHCGQIQNEFPIPQLRIEKDVNTCDACGSDRLEEIWADKKYCMTCGAIQELTIDL